jgi:ankyrin repeat protein
MASQNNHVSVVKLLLQVTDSFANSSTHWVNPSELHRTLAQAIATSPVSTASTTASDIHRIEREYLHTSRNNQRSHSHKIIQNISINHAKKNGNTALHIASVRGHRDVVALLLQCKQITVDARNSQDVTPLIMASQEGYIEIVEMLLHHDAQVNLRSKKGTTALFAASAFGHTQVVTLLLRHGADPSVMTDDGFSAIAIAYQEGYDDIKEILLQVSSNKICDERRCYT